MSSLLEHTSSRMFVVFFPPLVQCLITSQFLFLEQINQGRWVAWIPPDQRHACHPTDSTLLFLTKQWQNGHHCSFLNDRMEEHTPLTYTECPLLHCWVHYCLPSALLSYVISNLKREKDKVTLLAVVVCGHVFEGSKSVAAWHVLLKLFFQSLEASPVLFIGAELGDIKAWRVRHVDHIGVGQDHKLVFLLGRMIQ